MKRPWLKFYPSDWRAEPRLRMCSLAARGLWIDLISYMHEAEPYGHLLIEGVSPKTEEIASLVSRPLKEVSAALAELSLRRVFDKTTNGIIYSRRMVRDEKKTNLDKVNGAKGGNPTLIGGVNPPHKGGDKAQIPDTRVQIDDDEDDARAKAFKLAAKIGGLCGYPSPQDWPPSFCGAPHRIETWLGNGWNPDIIMVAVRETLSKKRDGPPSSVGYFEKAIATAHARQAAPLPKVTISQAKVEVTDARKTSGNSAIAAAREIRSRLEAASDDLEEDRVAALRLPAR
jgi:hypothetical protein